jgi:hypothetical protein
LPLTLSALRALKLLHIRIEVLKRGPKIKSFCITRLEDATES